MQLSGLRKTSFDLGGTVKICHLFYGNKMQPVIWRAFNNCCYMQEALQVEILKSLRLDISNLKPSTLKQVSQLPSEYGE